MPHVTGVVLAAGAGTRYGGPKALARDASGTPWMHRVATALAAGGCREVVVVLGAAASDARAVVPAGVTAVVAVDWEQGLSRSVRAGLDAAADADAVVLVPVDIPALPASAVARIVAAAGDEQRTALVRATYRGAPGHPVLIGAAHMAALRDGLDGDVGAGPYLRTHGAVDVECVDLWSGADIDTR